MVCGALGEDGEGFLYLPRGRLGAEICGTIENRAFGLRSVIMIARFIVRRYGDCGVLGVATLSVCWPSLQSIVAHHVEWMIIHGSREGKIGKMTNK